MSIPPSRPYQHRIWRRLRESDGDPEPIYERFITRLDAAEVDARLDADTDDGTKLSAITAEAVDWVARELDACVRSGETCIAIDGGWTLVVIFLHRVDYFLGYALAAASWCSQATPIRTGAIVDGIEAKLRSSIPYDIDQSVDWLPRVRTLVDFLRRARDELAAAREADAAPRDSRAHLDSASLAAPPSKVEPSIPGVAPVGSIATEAGPKSKRRPGRPSDTDHAKDRQIAEAWETGLYAAYSELAKVLGMTPRRVKLSIGRHRKRVKRARKREEGTGQTRVENPRQAR